MSLEQLADEADMSVSSVQRARKALRMAGAISWETPVGEAGKGKAVYRVHASVQRPQNWTGQSDQSAGSVNLTEPTGQSDQSGSVNLTSRDDVQESESRIGQSDQSGSVTQTDRKKNRSSVVTSVGNSPSVGVGFVAPQAATTETKTSKPQQSRGTRIPTDFTPTERDWRLMAPKCPDVNPHEETEQFRDHWKAATGRTATKQDWDAAWRYWMREAQKRATRGGGPRRVPTTQARVQAGMSLAEQLRAEENGHPGLLAIGGDA